MNILSVCLFRGDKKKKKKVLVNPSEFFHKKIFLFKLNPMKKVTYNAHPKSIQKGFLEKVKQTKEKIIGN